MKPHTLPHLHAPLVLTDGGLETTLVFHDGIDLPHFAAFTLLDSPAGRQALDRYVDSYVAVAEQHDLPLVVESPTWRASGDWASLLDVDDDELADLNRRAVAAVAERSDRIVVSGCVGPRGDGYVADSAMTLDEAATYHRPQVEALADGGAQLISAVTMTSIAEAQGVAIASGDAGLPCVISFTVETDGRLPSGEALGDAIAAVDTATAATTTTPAYYMINCAHPTHFADTLEPAPWMQRIRGIRANASTMSHAELDEADELDAGDAVDLADHYRQLRERFPQLTVFGGCCGTDASHIAAMASALTG